MPKLDKPAPSTETALLKPLAARIAALGELLALVGPVPETWLKTQASGPSGQNNPAGGLACLACDNWRSLVTAWRKALKWTEGLDYALSVMLASVTSTRSVGDQLWIKVIGPASCGKSTLCEALSVNRKYVLPKSTIRGFHSGYRTQDGEDAALINSVKDKSLVTKDGDTLLQSPNLGQILSEARDIYDSVSRSHYKNQMSNDYSGIRMTWILAGTSSLRQIDQSELGERFLDCVVMEKIDDELEDEILWRVANRVDRNLAVEADASTPETQYEPELALAMQLTGGYIDFLRENAQDLLSQVVLEDGAKRLITRLGKFVAFMRARPSKKQEEASEREFAARLVSQHVRLAKCLAVVMNRNDVDTQVMSRVHRVALDTSRGQTLELVKHLAKASLPVSSLALLTNYTEDKTRSLLRFLKQIGVVEVDRSPLPNGAPSKQPRLKLTAMMATLYEQVTSNPIVEV